jgi:membrane associated rhomboid family serine protease
MGTFNSKSFFKNASKSDIIKIIITISIVFVVLHFIRISIMMGGEKPTWFFEKIWNHITLSSNFNQAIRQPWSWITYIFCDMSIMQIIGNMIWLWVFGSVIEDLHGQYRILPIFITGGIIGALSFCVLNAFYPQGNFYYASAMPGVVAVAVATIIYKPKYEFWMLERFPIRIWVFGIIYLALQFLAMGGAFNLSFIALLFGGALVGVAYNVGFDFYFEAFSRGLGKLNSYFWNNRNFVVHDYRSKAKSENSKKSFQVISLNEQKLNLLLDKINEHGIQSLSLEEKRQLELFSQQN